jgi:hypothetical protein
MGTVFNNENSHLFTVLVEACKHFADRYAIIVSTGDEKTYTKYANSALNSDNILLVPHTPQVEILKRAHLFITHAGMNSVSEAVNYGVPIICLPLSGDQPFVAWRVADELQLGIRLQPDDSLTVERVKSTINTILSDPSYRERAQAYSNVSKGYAGHRAACELTVKLIQEHELKLKEGKENLKSPQPQPPQTPVTNPTTPLVNPQNVTVEPLTPLIDEMSLHRHNSAKDNDKHIKLTTDKKKKKLNFFSKASSKK